MTVVTNAACRSTSTMTARAPTWLTARPSIIREMPARDPRGRAALRIPCRRTGTECDCRHRAVALGGCDSVPSGAAPEPARYPGPVTMAQKARNASIGAAAAFGKLDAGGVA